MYVYIRLLIGGERVCLGEFDFLNGSGSRRTITRDRHLKQLNKIA